jgi:hypothetical protein
LVCDRRPITADDCVWGLHGTDTSLRNFFSENFYLRQDDWEGDWGWGSNDPNWAFPKMLNACYLIYQGLNPYRRARYGTWRDCYSTTPIHSYLARLDHPISALGMEAFICMNNSIFRDTHPEVVADGMIGIKAVYYRGTFWLFTVRDSYLTIINGEPGSWSVNVLDRTRCPNGAPHELSGNNLDGVIQNGDELDLFLTDYLGHLWHLDTPEFTFENVHDLSFDIQVSPLIPEKESVLKDDNLVHIFCHTQFNDLMQFTYLKHNVIIKRIKKVRMFRGRVVLTWWVRKTITLPHWRVRYIEANGSSLNGKIVSVKTSDGRLHLFEKRTINRVTKTIYHLSKSGGFDGTWSSETLDTTPLILDNDIDPVVTEGLPSSGILLHLFLRSTDGKLIHFYLDESNTWHNEDVTAVAEYVGTAPVHKIIDRPAVFRRCIPSYPSSDRINVYARDTTKTYILRFFLDPDGRNWRCQQIGYAAWPGITDVSNSFFTPPEPSALDVWSVEGQVKGPIPEYPGTADLTPHCFQEIYDGRPWHSNRDYFEWSKGQRYKPKNSDNHGSWACGWPNWYIEMYCPSFYSGPGERAALMIHEATHEIFSGSFNVFQYGHTSDPWQDHSLSDIPLDTLDYNNSNHLHYPYQMQIEFLIDLYEFPAENLEYQIYSTCKSTAQWLMDNYISPMPAWYPGDSRPL